MTQEDKRLKEIEHLLWLKEELLKTTKKEIKNLQIEKADIEGQKRLEKRR